MDDQPIQEGQTLTGPIFNEPMKIETVRDSGDGVWILGLVGTVVRWNRKGFRLYWRWKSRRRDGRPGVPRDVRDLIRRMAQTNPLWGAPRIHGELLKLGIEVAQTSVAKYMPRRRNPPSSTWRSFLNNHVTQIIACDFLTVHTATFGILDVLVVLAHDRRRVLHFNVTEHPTARWTGQQLREACPWDAAPRSLLRYRDGIYGDDIKRIVHALGRHLNPHPVTE